MTAGHDPRLTAVALRAAAMAWTASPRRLVWYGLTLLAEALLPLTAAWLTKLVIDALAGSGSPDLPAQAAALAAVGVAAAVLPQGERYLSREIGRDFGVTATDRLFAATERLTGLARFEDARFLDRLRLGRNAVSLGANLITGSFGMVRAGVSLIGLVGALAVLSPIMAAVVVAGAVPSLLAQLRLARRRAGMAWQTSPAERREMFYARLLGTVEAAKEIRLFGSGGLLRGRMMGERRAINAAERRMDVVELRAEGLLSGLAAVVAGGGLVWAVLAARDGRLSVGDVSLFAAVVAAVQGGLAALVSSLGQARFELLGFSHFLAVVQTGPDLPIPAAPRALPPLRRGIELRDVWFRYSDDHPWILRGVDLTIPYGSSVALVGRNGAGKSTLVKLLCRFYDPTRGTITWDGVDLREAAPASLRRRVACVFQDFMTYDFSAADNIGVADPSGIADRRRIEAAGARAGADGALRALPHGYDTPLSRAFFGEDEVEDPAAGVVLSGGQWQRVALARGFMRDDPDLMILDEPSSGLDPEGEHDVHHRMRAHRAGRTSLLISHRLNTVRDADTIVVLEEGVVSERGEHAELMKAGGVYERLFRLQSAGYQVEEAAR
ncbi:ABC transporter ATP-binding protein [Nonomuraea sp. NPDC049684]|uniref:ABC transporter ATP-binding protein n=1 Tax=Nonomuraea sp. NPDC049684 TaxID=3364356 RepID=UPI0037B607F9